MASLSPAVLSSALTSLQTSMLQFISTTSQVFSQLPLSSPHQPLPQLNPIPPLPIAFPNTVIPFQFAIASSSSIPTATTTKVPAVPISTGGIAQTPIFSQITQAAHRQNPTDPLLSSTPRPFPPPSETAMVKIRSLQDRRSKGHAVCFRCGDQSHLASTCRNSVVYFLCGHLGHRSHQCRSTIMFQPPPSKPSPKFVAQVNSLPIIKFYPNPANKKFHSTIQNSLVLHDELELGPIYIQTYLHKLFPISDLGWLVLYLGINI
jgi:hypothetical protein